MAWKFANLGLPANPALETMETKETKETKGPTIPQVGAGRTEERYRTCPSLCLLSPYLNRKIVSIVSEGF
jgi:hypothetical protein